MIFAPEMSYIFFFFLFSYGLCKGAEVSNLGCTNDYICDMTCIWEADEGINCTAEYTLHYKRINEPELKDECIPSNSRVDDNVLATHCECSIRIPYFVAADEYLVTLMCRGEQLLNNTITIPDSIKLKPPYNLTVEKNADENFVLKWYHHYKKSLLKSFLKFEVSYRRKQDPEKNSIVRESSDDSSFLIINSDLEAKCDYIAKVRAMPTKVYNGEWSEWTPYVEWNTEYTAKFTDNLPVIISVISLLLVASICICHRYIKKLKKKWEQIPNAFYSQAAKMQLYPYPASTTCDPEYKKEELCDVILSCSTSKECPKQTNILDEDKCVIFRGDIPFNDSTPGLLFGHQNWFSNPFIPKLLINSQPIWPEDCLFNRQSEELFLDRSNQFRTEEHLFGNSSGFPLSASESKYSKYPSFVFSYKIPPLPSQDWNYPEVATFNLPELDHQTFKNSSGNICHWPDVLFHHAAPKFIRPDTEKYGNMDFERVDYKSFTSCVEECLPDNSDEKSTLRKTMTADEMSEGTFASLCISKMQDPQHFNSKEGLQPSGLAASGYQSFNSLVAQPFGPEKQDVVDRMRSSSPIVRPEMPPSSDSTTNDPLTADSNAGFSCTYSEISTTNVCYSTDKKVKLTEHKEDSLQCREMMNIQLEEICQSGFKTLLFRQTSDL